MRQLTRLLLFLLPFALFSCGSDKDEPVPEEPQEIVNGGWPQKVTFPKEGGEVVITGDDHPFGFYLYKRLLYDGEKRKEVEGQCTSPGVYTATLEWLTVTTRGKDLVLTATPNEDGRLQKIGLCGFTVPGYFQTEVCLEGNFPVY